MTRGSFDISVRNLPIHTERPRSLKQSFCCLVWFGVTLIVWLVRELFYTLNLSSCKEPKCFQIFCDKSWLYVSASRLEVPIYGSRSSACNQTVLFLQAYLTFCNFEYFWFTFRTINHPRRLWLFCSSLSLFVCEFKCHINVSKDCVVAHMISVCCETLGDRVINKGTYILHEVNIYDD